MTQLSDLGFVKGEIVEIVVSTYSEKGEPNAAPMGAIMLSEEELILKVFHSSLTFKNLQTIRCAVVNVTSKIDIFYKTALKEINPNGKLPAEWFDKAQTVNAPKLRMAEAIIETTINKIETVAPDRSQVNCTVKQIAATSMPAKVHSRAFGATLEAIVHATRVKAFIDNKNKKEKVAKLLALISNCNDTVNKTGPDSRYAEIMADLDKRINSWRTKM